MSALRVAGLPLEIEAMLLPDNLSEHGCETGVAAVVCCRSCCTTGITGFSRLDDLEADCDFSEALLDDLLVPRLSVGVLPCCRDGDAPFVSEL